MDSNDVVIPITNQCIAEYVAEYVDTYYYMHPRCSLESRYYMHPRCSLESRISQLEERLIKLQDQVSEILKDKDAEAIE